MAADKKQVIQFQRLLSPKDHGLMFQNPEAEAAYKARINHLNNAVQLKKAPDRVPLAPFPSIFPYTYAKMTVEEA